MAEKSYAGKVQNTGSQVVKAIFPTAKKSKSTVKTGDDLRAKK